MKKFTLILIGYLVTASSVIAQESSFTIKADSVIAPLDKSQIPTGILYDRAYPLARLDIFNQQGFIDTTSTEHWMQTYMELYTASFDRSGWKRPSYFGDSI